MTMLRARLAATTNGIPTRVTAFDATHRVDQPIATGSVSMKLPLPPHLHASDANVFSTSIEIQAGTDQRGIRTRFKGNIIRSSMRIDARSRTATFALQGDAARLAYPLEEDVTFPSRILLAEVIRSFCVMRGLSAFRVDRMTYIDGVTDIRMGGNPDIDNGALVVTKDTSPLDWITRKCVLFGYRAFETPGEWRVQRVSGEPVGSVHESYVEGVNGYNLTRDSTNTTIRTFWTVEGPTYTDSDGVSIPIRSIPANVPPSPYLGGRYRSDRITDRDLTRDDLAEAVRNVAEIDHSEPEATYDMDVAGKADLYPGDVIRFESTSMGFSGNHWCMGIREAVDQNGYLATVSAWSGGGQPLAAGSDAVFINIPGGPWHVGDEHVAWYAVPQPSNGSVDIPFNVPNTFTSIAVSFLGHGMNSQLIGGINTDLDVSKLEVWQGGDKAVGSAELPVMPEDYALQRPYGAGSTWWTRGRMPVPGRLEPGAATLKFVPGDTDDFEVKSIVIELRGVGMPTLPSLGGG